MGFADALVRLGIPYNSPEGVEFGRTLQEFIDTESKRESERLANQRGAFPEWARSIWGPDETCARDENGAAHSSDADASQLQRHHRRADRHDLDHRRLLVGNRAALRCRVHAQPGRRDDARRERRFRRDREARRLVLATSSSSASRSEGHIHFDEVPEKWQRVFVTAHDIAPEWHVRMQAAFQEHCDSAISKTTNFPHAASREDVRAIYELAYDLKCKGVTVYRDGSRDKQVLSTGATAQATASRDDRTGERREMGELHGTIAEMTAEIERLKQSLYDAEAENLQRRVKRSRPDELRGTTHPQGNAARHDVREHHRRRQGSAVRGLHQPGQGRRRRDGGRRSDGPHDLARAALGHSAARGAQAAARDQLGSRCWAWAEQGALGARRHRHRAGRVDAREAGGAAGSALIATAAAARRAARNDAARRAHERSSTGDADATWASTSTTAATASCRRARTADRSSSSPKVAPSAMCAAFRSAADVEKQISAQPDIIYSLIMRTSPLATSSFAFGRSSKTPIGTVSDAPATDHLLSEIANLKLPSLRAA